MEHSGTKCIGSFLFKTHNCNSIMYLLIPVTLFLDIAVQIQYGSIMSPTHNCLYIAQLLCSKKPMKEFDQDKKISDILTVGW